MIVKFKYMFTLLAAVALPGSSAAQQGAAPALQGTILDGTGLPGQAWTSLWLRVATGGMGLGQIGKGMSAVAEAAAAPGRRKCRANARQ